MRSKAFIFLAITSCYCISCRKDKQVAIVKDTNTTWKQTWGSNNVETTRSLAVAQDGSIVLIGSAFGTNVWTYYWIVGFDGQGHKQWETLLDTINSPDVIEFPPELQSVCTSSDGGYALAAHSEVADKYGGVEQLTKLNKNGEVIWQHYYDYDSSMNFYASSVAVTSIISMPDEGYITAGEFRFIEGEASVAYYWVVKFHNNGEKEWDRIFGPADGIFCSQGASAVVATEDGGCIVVGSGFAELYSDNSDFLIFKLNTHGEIVWRESFGGSLPEYATCIATTKGGGCIVSGTTSSQDGDVEGFRVGAFNDRDIWVLKLDRLGEIVWQKTLGGFQEDKASSAAVTPDGGCILAGTTASNSGDVTGNHGYTDCWLVKLDSGGSLVWQKTLGGFNDDEANAIAVSPDGGYVMAGTTWSNDGDVYGNSGLSDAFIVKINE